MFDISSLEEWRTQAYENAKLFKEKVKRWHDKEFKSVSLKLENMFFCTTLISGSLQENSSQMGRTLCYRGGLSVWSYKINNAECTNPKVVNGRRIKHYFLGTPINVEINITQTLSPEEHIK